MAVTGCLPLTGLKLFRDSWIWWLLKGFDGTAGCLGSLGSSRKLISGAAKCFVIRHTLGIRGVLMSKLQSQGVCGGKVFSEMRMQEVASHIDSNGIV